MDNKGVFNLGWVFTLSKGLTVIFANTMNVVNFSLCMMS